MKALTEKLQKKANLSGLDLMALMNEVLAFLHFTHEERTKIFMVIKKHPKKFYYVNDLINEKLKPGTTRQEIRTHVLEALAIK
jgi:hypothetical protein